MRWRHRFTVVVGAVTMLLMGWGAFVTSIEAGLAVPDWPSSFDSWDPFNPWPGWWEVTPVFAEHGHRLLGMLTGVLTIALTVWTWIAERRRWLRRLAVAALLLVSLQGLLGGLRVVWLSLELALVHASAAQLFLGLIVAMAVFTSDAWRGEGRIPVGSSVSGGRGVSRLALATLGALYLQIVLGALLRHPGAGIHPVLAGLHIGWAVVVAIMVAACFRRVRRDFRDAPLLAPAARLLAVLVVLQLAGGLTAYLVTLDDAGMLQPGNLQVVLNTSHAVIGGFLMAAAVAAVLGAFRRDRAAGGAPAARAAIAREAVS